MEKFDPTHNEQNERRATTAEREELQGYDRLEGQNPEINADIYRRIMGSVAIDYFVPVDPMDDLQCDSCQ